ncbi:hypothetical protein D3C76_1884770 [compost metagenome]
MKVLSVRVESALKEKMEALAAATERDVGWHARKALEKYLKENEWQVSRPDDNEVAP